MVQKNEQNKQISEQPVGLVVEAGVGQSVSSIELSKNSKGYNWSIKVYNNDLEKAMTDIVRYNGGMCKLYGMEIGKD